ncbi:MAG: phage portal protein [Clostridia bacterium]|nr:phage portal protein [Clostridia bacterium]
MSLSDVIMTELSGLYGQRVLEDMGNIIALYDFYDGKGQDWKTPTGLDYQPSKLVTNLCKKLIKREARFMFGRTPEIRLRAADGSIAQEHQQTLARVLEDNSFPERLIKGLRDCLIGKRVAIKLSGGVGQPIGVQIRPSLEFVYEPFDDDADRLKKIIFFYRLNNESKLSDQRIWRQKYEMQGGRCFLTEGVYDGHGELVEGGECVNTGLSFIPCRVVINDGLTGDLMGESDVEELMASQMAYNRLKSDDLDALRFNMFPQRVAVDADSASLENMVIAPGSLIDLVTDPARGDDGRQASISMLEPKFGYNARFENTIDRIKQDMHELVGVPNVSPDQLRGFAQSGRAIKALYWELTERCEERWTVWEPALKWMCRAIMSMLSVYGDTQYDEDFSVHIEHLYPIMEDEEGERELDLREVSEGVRSSESYREKWNILD